MAARPQIGRLVDLITGWVRAERPTMKSHDLEKRIAAALRQRLRAAPAALRAMAMAETVAWQAPAFAGDDGQQAAMHALLRACDDARAATQRP
jgi:hypothetical protein